MGVWIIPADLGSWEEVSAQMESELRDNRCPAETAVSIIVAADEIFANISSYAYQGGGGLAEIKTRCERLDDGRNEYRLTFSDRGIAFNPCNAPEDEKGTLALQKYKSGIQGGFGIPMIKDKADRLSYQYKNGRNILCFIKYYTPATTE